MGNKGKKGYNALENIGYIVGVLGNTKTCIYILWNLYYLIRPIPFLGICFRSLS